ncbi:Fibrous sheath-interacting protein 2 [Dufourea novaeangliae]|uniref:Fibrous sheath-interacting protein 2 n=1 Tax=Dufourea novaeangliae TaxID=178035 RepID=A0A154P3Y8_DUFNO|nr:Fibrous sheath-interacting protein 2 [Dufourea novaeangliae]
MPLESKIPMVPGPEGAYNFTRRKLGKELWIPAPDGDFNLNDPYCYEMELTYDSLHDKHLVPYFSRPNNIRHLLKAGLITKSLDAKCSLRDYNMYRKYLRKIHSDGIKKELNRSSKWSTEEAAIMYAEEQAQNEVRRLKRRERLMKIRGASIRKRKQAEKLKARQQKEKERKTEERLQALMLKKQEDINLQRLKRSERADLLRQKQKAAADRERKKLIDVLIEWTKKERIRTKTRNTRMNQEREERRMKVERKWEERQEFQKKQMEKEQFLLQCIENQRERFIGEYNYKVEKETKRMQKLLSDVKMFMKCYFARHQGGAERICCLKDSDFDMNQSVKSPTTPDGSSHAQKQDKKELRYLDKKLASKHKEGWKKKKDADLKETSSYSEASKIRQENLNLLRKQIHLGQQQLLHHQKNADVK